MTTSHLLLALTLLSILSAVASTSVKLRVATNATEKRGPADCMRFTSEPWAADVKYLCGIRHNGAYDFYYKLASGTFLRNCFCSDLKSGTVGGVLQIRFNSQKDESVCYSNRKKDNFTKIYDSRFETVEKCPDEPTA